ncbi:hypothetical protein [Scytonema sp. NUACC26]|uniref:hypothetical protein n=1 Tax=Scytonema sp. NUACC26 TaxID=3140176 RepID=UPI0034DC228A
MNVRRKDRLCIGRKRGISLKRKTDGAESPSGAQILRRDRGDNSNNHLRSVSGVDSADTPELVMQHLNISKETLDAIPKAKLEILPE